MQNLNSYERERQQRRERRDRFDAETVPLGSARMFVRPHGYAVVEGEITLGLRGGFFVTAETVTTRAANEHHKEEARKFRDTYNHEAGHRSADDALAGGFRRHVQYSPVVLSGHLQNFVENKTETPKNMDHYLFDKGPISYLRHSDFSLVDAVRETGESPLKAVQDAFYSGKMKGGDPRAYAAFLATDAVALNSRDGSKETEIPSQMPLTVDPKVLRDRDLRPEDLKTWAATTDLETRTRLAAIEKCRKSEAPGSLKAARDLEALGIELYDKGRQEEALLPFVVAAKQAQAERHLVKQSLRSTAEAGVR